MTDALGLARVIGQAAGGLRSKLSDLPDSEISNLGRSRASGGRAQVPVIGRAAAILLPLLLLLVLAAAPVAAEPNDGVVGGGGLVDGDVGLSRGLVL